MFLAFSQYRSNFIPSLIVILSRSFSQTGKKNFRVASNGARTQSQNSLREMSSKSQSTSSSNSTVTKVSVEDNVDKVLSNVFSFCSFVQLDRLTADEKLIHSKHMKALQNNQEMYEDPSTGYSVLTRLAHLKRGQCCGNACRHCPYGQRNVPAHIPRKTYNTAFFA